MKLPFNHIQLLRYAGLFTYVCVGIPLLRNTWVPQIVLGSLEHFGWIAGYLLFGMAYWSATADLGRPYRWQFKLPLLVVMNAAAFTISYITGTGLSALLLVVVAGVLPWLLPFWPGLIWAVLQNFTLMPVFARVPDFGWLDAFLQSALYLGFGGFTYITSLVAKQQAQAREEQRRLNSELRATRTLVAESSRIAERLRISRELHDLVGHHLIALSLNMEVASHLVSGAAAEHVRQAQAVAKLLLTDVREVVSQLREDDALDLTQVLHNLVEGVPGLHIHLELPPRFSVDDPRRAQVLLRCAQEIITNTVRHSGADHLWLRFERTAENALVIHAHDDGHGVDGLRQGNGLIGMRERLAQLGGRLQIATAKGQGFALDAWLPLETTP